jgi:hypothetical protein
MSKISEFEGAEPMSRSERANDVAEQWRTQRADFG